VRDKSIALTTDLIFESFLEKGFGQISSALTLQMLVAFAVITASPTHFPSHTVAIFLDTSPPADALARVSGVKDEQMRLGKREIFVYYGAGIGKSKLNIPAAKSGTARNMNTIAKLAQMAANLSA
jgi:uncharacterized protein (DUF1697 family)